MKTKHYFSGILLVGFSFLFSGSNLQAQTSLKIQKADNSVVDYPITNIKKVFFPTASILEVDNGSAAQVQISTIKKIYFGNTIATLNSVVRNISMTRLFPIPATDQLTLEVHAHNTEAGYIEIIDLAGYSVSTQKISLHTGLNSFTINSSVLRTGFYFCKVSSANSIGIIKFNKQ